MTDEIKELLECIIKCFMFFCLFRVIGQVTRNVISIQKDKS